MFEALDLDLVCVCTKGKMHRKASVFNTKLLHVDLVLDYSLFVYFLFARLYHFSFLFFFHLLTVCMHVFLNIYTQYIVLLNFACFLGSTLVYKFFTFLSNINNWTESCSTSWCLHVSPKRFPVSVECSNQMFLSVPQIPPLCTCPNLCVCVCFKYCCHKIQEHIVTKFNDIKIKIENYHILFD